MLTSISLYRPRPFAPVLGFLACALAAVGMATLLAIQPIIPFALLYVLAFLWVAVRTPALCVAFAFGLGLFPFDLGGGGIAIGPSEFHLALLTLIFVVSCLLRRATMRFNPLLLPAVLYLGICVASATLHWWGNASIVSLLQMFLYLVITVLVFSNLLPTAESYNPCFIAVVGAGFFLAVATVVSGSNYVFGLHKNAIGGAVSYALIICCEMWLGQTQPRRRLMYAIAFLVLATGLFMSLSRGAWFSSLVGISIIVLMRRQFRLALMLLLLVVPLIFLLVQYMPADTRDYAFTFSSDRTNIAARFESLDYAREQFEKSPVLGFGVGLRKLFDATNIIYLTLAETGLAGLAAFSLIHLVYLAMVVRTARRLPVRSPYYGLLTIGTALLFAKLVHGCVDHYWSRGSLLVVWGAVGMAVKAFHAASRRSPA